MFNLKDLNKEWFGMAHFTPHDLRRTAATGFARLGHGRHVIERILNHSEGGKVTAIYDRYEYAKEKRAALENWSQHVSKIIRKKPGKSHKKAGTSLRHLKQ